MHYVFKSDDFQYEHEGKARILKACFNSDFLFVVFTNDQDSNDESLVIFLRNGEKKDVANSF